MTRSVPQVLAALLLRARRSTQRAPRALRLRLAWPNARPARRQGPAGASGPGHDAWPACGRGAHFLLAELAGRSPVMTHGGVCGRRACAPALLVEALRKWRGGRRSRLGTLGPAATRPWRVRVLHCIAVLVEQSGQAAMCVMRMRLSRPRLPGRCHRPPRPFRRAGVRELGSPGDG